MNTQRQIADLNGHQTAYLDLEPPGATKTILLIHGFASTASVNWVTTGWAKTLNEAGYRVIALDNRGHGKSGKYYAPEDYGPDIFATDALALLDHLNIKHCDVMGYSMGARITCWLCYAAPERFRRAVFGGMGEHIFGNRGGYEEIAHALETDDMASITSAGAWAFRKFADATHSDRMALAACIRPSKVKITPEIVKEVRTRVLVAVGGEDEIGGSPSKLAEMMPNAESFVIANLDHMKATGAKEFQQKALEFLTGDDL